MNSRSSRSPLRLVGALFLLGSLPSALAGAPITLGDSQRIIQLRSRAIDTSQAQPERTASVSSDSSGNEIVLVKFRGPATERQMEMLRASSLRIYTYLPDHAFLVKVAADRRTLLGSQVGAWTGRYLPEDKISPAVAGLEATGKPEDATPRIVMIQVFPDADIQEVVRRIKSDLGVPGVVGWSQGSFFSRIRLLLTPAEVAAHRESLAEIGDVFWIDTEPRRSLLNDTTVWVGQSGLTGGQTTPLFTRGIYGEGQVVAILDTGIDADMCWFRDTALGLPPTNACNGGTVVNTNQRKVIGVNFLWSTDCAGGISSGDWDNHDHGSHVAGTVAGDNFANLLIHDAADGMAPGAKLVIQDGGLQTDNCGDLPGIGCPVVDLNPIFQQTYDQGARIHSNSWGDNENAAVQNNYSAGSQDVDEFMWNHKDFLIFFAAGNSGPSNATVGSPSTAKSGVSVGATLRGTLANGMAGFSSCGPTLDGRIKPDLTVPGNLIVAANNDLNVGTNNCGTRNMSGTSMATPGAAGLAALVRQYYMDGWYPKGAEDPLAAFTPSAALVKATLINSAASMTGATVIPSTCQGWGRILLENALFFNGQTRRLWIADEAPGFATGVNRQISQTFKVNSSAEPLKVTLAWTDFPSTPAASINLVNDLDLTVSGPSGGFWRGNVFSGGQSAAGGSADRRNTVEQVLLNAPAPGTYTVTVKTFNIPSGPQPWSLVVTGDLTAQRSGPTVPAP